MKRKASKNIITNSTKRRKIVQWDLLYVDFYDSNEKSVTLKFFDSVDKKTVYKKIDFQNYYYVENENGKYKNVYNWDKNEIKKVSKSNIHENELTFEMNIGIVAKFFKDSKYIVGDNISCVFYIYEKCQYFYIKNGNIVWVENEINEDIPIKITWDHSTSMLSNDIYYLKNLLINLGKFKNIESIIKMDLFYDFEEFKTILSTWLPVALKINEITKCPLKFLFNNKSPHTLAFNYFKYGISSKYDVILPTIEEEKKFDRIEVERFNLVPEKGKIFRNDVLNLLDFSSFFPSVYLKIFCNSNVHAHSIHCECLQKLLEKKRSSDNNLSYKLLLNAGGYGKLGATENPRTTFFKSNKLLMKKIVEGSKIKMEKVAKIFEKRGFEIVYGLTDSFLIRGNTDKIIKLMNNINDDLFQLKYQGTFDYAFFLDCNTYLLKNSKDDLFVKKGRIFNSHKTPFIIKQFYLEFVELLFNENIDKISYQKFLELFKNYFDNTAINWKNCLFLKDDDLYVCVKGYNYPQKLKDAILNKMEIDKQKIFSFYFKEMKSYLNKNFFM